ncbi:hypothetical protein K432DRAFT_421743 [Lepidopterella palustris CBS 459.81]|uniref:Uncharacterized protein n=1 Tax=Lepidopterella palustris CBS 459.81 TaxID=1314670 RepID=A0A8E2EK33_9PEZI|nr:hypothetical protein K432DRAFT_421743 [Lepidopterella palustris CBS 459.81]
MAHFAENTFALDEMIKGGWLCAQGPYLDYISELTSFNPGLKKADPKNKENHPLKPGNATVVMLEMLGGDRGVEKKEFKCALDLQKYFDQEPPVNTPNPRRRIYLMEGLAQDYVSVLGKQFYMDPSFFMRQERTCVWSNDFTPISDALPQPSLLQPNKNFLIQYCELRQFDNELSNAPLYCHRTGRHIGMTPARMEEKTTTGILRRKCSFWSRRTNGGGWDAVFLCDPQLEELWPKQPKQINNDSFQEGYIDFLPTPDHLTVTAKPKHPRTSMLRDMCYYLENHHDLIPTNDWNDPVSSSLFMKKIIAAHYLQLVDYIKAMLPSLELRLSSGWIEEQEQWRSLQTISRRCGNYRDDIEDTLLSLGLPLSEPNSTSTDDWKDYSKDFQYIYLRLKLLKQRADSLMTAMTGLASIAGNRQALDEAKRAKRLTLIGMVFIPLAYSTSLFSMSGNFAPGQSQFWVYWAVSVPLIVVTFVVTYMMNLVLDEKADFTLRRFRKKDSVQRRKKRAATGIWTSGR